MESCFDPSHSYPYLETHPSTLALYCSDGRFTAAVAGLCMSLGELRIDTITIPGGPGLLDMAKLAVSERDVTLRALDFLIKGHGITRVVLVAHEGCGYYKRRYPKESDEQREKRQIQDLWSAAGTLHAKHGVYVDAFFAHVEDSNIRFEQV